MHEISLLGGLGNGRHSDGMHVLRPDRVYRTSVLSPMTGFRPGEDVMANARDFTMGPYSGMSLSGLRGTPLFPRLRAWWSDVKARAKAGTNAVAVVMVPASSAPATAAQVQVHAPGASLPPQAQGHAYGLMKHGGNSAPMYATGQYVGPLTRHLPQQMVTASYGQSSSLPTYAADAASKTTMMMWRGLRFPWG